MPTSEIAQALAGLKSAHLDLLYSQVVRRLAGQPVTIEWRPPIMEGARGLTFKRAGRLVCQIDPELDPEGKLTTFFHEAAHCKLHAEGLADETDFASLPELAEPTRAKYPDWLLEQRRSEAKRRETEAQALALEWTKAAGAGSVRQRLLRLLR